jgi:D-3-phosphoglycerate dehydrogenase
MRNWSDLENCRIVRLNATLFPVSEFEASLYEKYNLRPVQVEANSPEEIIPHVEDCDALFAISVSLPEAVVSSLSRCRVISRLGTGTDKIDVAMATREGILVTNVPYFCVEEQADHTMAMMLALARKLPQMARAMVEGAWSHSKRQSRSNQRLSTQTLGLLGFGNSAIATAKRAKGFGMRVIATRRNMKAPRDEADELGVRMVSLDTLLAESDYVSLHLPLNSETYHMLDDAELGKMKLGAHLINTSRGALVDEMALVKALREGRLSGAGLDTFEEINPFTEDEAPPDHPLLELDNVVLTPHVGAYSVQAAQDVSRGGVQNVVSVLSGHMPLGENIVNPSVTPRFPLADYDAMLFEDDGH